MGGPPSPDASLEQILQISSVLSSLEADLAMYNGDNESDVAAHESGWTAVNCPTSNSFEGLTSVNDTAGGEVSDAALPEESAIMEYDIDDEEDRDTCLMIKGGQVVAYHVPTGVYMMNAQAGSWSGRMPQDEEANELEIQAIVAMNHLRRAQEMATAQQLKTERRTAQAYSATYIPMHGLDSIDSDGSEEYRVRKDVQAAKIDMKIRNDIKLMKMSLADRGVLNLEHTGAHDVDNNMYCRYAYCMSDDQCIPAHSYYITLSVNGDSRCTCRYCLTCFEAIWHGELLRSDLPDPRVFKVGSDGQVQESIDCACHGAALITQEKVLPMNAAQENIVPSRDFNSATKPNHFKYERRDSAQQLEIEAPAPLIHRNTHPNQTNTQYLNSQTYPRFHRRS